MARSIALGNAGTGRSRGLLILAIVFGILSFVLAFVFLQSQGGESSTSVLGDNVAPEEVVVALRDIEPGDRITSDMIKLEVVPGAALQSGRFLQLDLVEGMTAQTLILAGEQVVAPKITAFGGLDILSARVPEDSDGQALRGLGLTVPHESWIVGGLVQPGDRVDVVGITTLVEVDELTGAETLSLKTAIIAQNIEVLAVSQTITSQIPNQNRTQNAAAGATGDAADEDGATDEEGTDATDGAATTDAASDAAGGVVDNLGTFAEAISVTLALSPEESAKLALIDALEDDTGQWRLIVRQKGDETPVTGDLSWDINDIFPEDSSD